MPRRKTKSVVLITDSIFIPPCVQYNPFSQRYIGCPEDKEAAGKLLSAFKAGAPAKHTQESAVNAFLHSPRRAANDDDAHATNGAGTACDDLSVSDWTDCDEQEFDSLLVGDHHTHMLLNRCISCLIQPCNAPPCTAGESCSNSSSDQ